MERETEVLVVTDEFKTTGKADVNTRAIIMRGLKRLRKKEEEEDEEDEEPRRGGRGGREGGSST